MGNLIIFFCASMNQLREIRDTRCKGLVYFGLFILFLCTDIVQMLSHGNWPLFLLVQLPWLILFRTIHLFFLHYLL